MSSFIVSCSYLLLFFFYFVWSFRLFRLFDSWLVPLRQYSSSKFSSFYSPPHICFLKALVPQCPLHLRWGSKIGKFMKLKKPKSTLLAAKTEGLITKQTDHPPPSLVADSDVSGGVHWKFRFRHQLDRFRPGGGGSKIGKFMKQKILKSTQLCWLETHEGWYKGVIWWYVEGLYGGSLSQRNNVQKQRDTITTSRLIITET